MWSYYGSKSKIVDCYPKPKQDTVIEPFAGSARYALKWFDRKVILNDKYELIADLWRFLQQASEKDILGLPNLKAGETLDNYDLSKEEKWLIGFCINGGSAQPKKTVKDYNTWDEAKKRIAGNLFKIRHWTITSVDYNMIENQTATWFIDPPYQVGGEWYVKSNKHIDFRLLADWCKERQGQTIVCENSKADWLDFKPMKDMQGAMFKTKEVIWSNERTAYDDVQTSLF